MSIRQILDTRVIYFTGLLMLVAGLPVSLFLTSLSQFVLIGSFFLEGNLKEKFQRFFSNKTALLFSGIWLIHLIGLFWTTDLAEGFKDLRIKLPILMLPLILAGNRPLSPIRFRWVLITFVLSVFIATMICMAVLAGFIQRNIYDIRDIFIFNISHIRFALFTCLSIYSVYWLAFGMKIQVNKFLKILSVILIIWLVVFLVIAESVTGLLILAISGLIFLLYFAFSTSNLRARILLFLTVLIVPLGCIVILEKFIGSYYSNHPYPINTEEKTLLGNEYQFNLDDPLYENGYPVWVYICDEEMRSAWNQRSSITYDSLDERKQPLKFTLVRFLASKGLKKDAEGVNKLSDKEIHSVERGVANVNYQEISSIRSRLLQIMWEFDEFIKGRNPSGHSVIQRLEFWKTAWAIVKNNMMTGVGTGDMPDSFHQMYIEMHSTLDEQHRLRSHNQYLAILVAFGIGGLLYFVVAFFYPLFSYRQHMNFLFAAFFLIAFLSMLTEDTLETQAGATFVAFFFSFLLFAKPLEASQNHLFNTVRNL